MQPRTHVLTRSTFPHFDAGGRLEGVDDPLEGAPDLVVRQRLLRAPELQRIGAGVLEHVEELDLDELLAAVLPDRLDDLRVRDAAPVDERDVAADARKARHGRDAPDLVELLQERLRLQLAQHHLRRQAERVAQLRRDGAEHADRLAVQLHLQRRALRERRMVRRDELDAPGVETPDKLLDRALHPEHGLLLVQRQAAAQRLAPDRADEAEREQFALRRLVLRGHLALRRNRHLAEDLARLEQQRGRLVRRVLAERRVHLRQETVAHEAVFGGHGIGNREPRPLRLLARIEVVQLLLGQEGIVHRLGEAEPHRNLAQPALRAERRVGERRDGRRARHGVRDVVQPVEARDFLDEVGLHRKVPAPGRDLERDVLERGEVVGLRRRAQTERLQQEDHPVVADVDADQLARAVEVERDGCVQRLRTVVDVHHALRNLGRAVLLQKMRRTARGEVGDVLVHAADVAVGRLARQAKLRRRVLRRRRLEKRGFEEDALRLALGDAGVLAAHDAGDAVRTRRVADHQHRRVKLARHAVQRLDRLALFRAADDDRAPLQLRVVEGVQRRADFHEHVVRDVDDEAERADAAELQALRHQGGRRPVLHARHNARRVARTLHGIFDDDLDLVVHVRRGLGEVDRRQRQRTVQDRSELAGEADDRQRVRPVPRHLDVEDNLRLLQLRDVPDGRAVRDLGRILDDAVVPLAEAQLLLAAAHAEALDAAQLALLDLLRVAVLVEERGNRRADLRERRLDALPHVRRAADDLEVLPAVRHRADVQVVGVRMRRTGDDLGDDDQVGERTPADRLDRLDLQPGTGQLLGKFLRVDVIDLDVLIQPRQGQSHLSSPLLQNFEPRIARIRTDLPVSLHPSFVQPRISRIRSDSA